MNKQVNANLILEFRKANKMTIKEFCEQSNIGTTAYYRIMKGKNTKVQTLFGIARLMNVSMTQLLA